MKMTIEVESLDDLISLIGLVRVMQDTKSDPKPTASEPAPKAPELPVVTNRIERPESFRPSAALKEAEERANKIAAFNNFLSLDISHLKLWPPAERSLREWGNDQINDLYFSSPRSLKDIPDVGLLTIRQIRDAFAARGEVWIGESHDC